MFDDPSVYPAFNEPPPLAREHWPKLAKALRKLDELRARQNAMDAEQQQLREQLADAQTRDRQALGEALAAGEPDPPSEADALEQEIDSLGRRVRALGGAINSEIEKFSAWVDRERGALRQDHGRRLADGAALYLASIVAMVEARDRLVAEVKVGAWLEHFPDGGPEPATGFIPNDPLLAHQPPRSFANVAEDLRRDSERLPTAGPSGLNPEFLRRMDRHRGRLCARAAVMSRERPGSTVVVAPR